MSAVEIQERPYIPPPQPIPAFELALGEEVILLETDVSLNEQGWTKELKKIKNRYHLIGMTKRQYDYMCAVNSFQKGPGLPFPTTDSIAEEINKAYFTTYTIRRELIEAELLIIRYGTMPGGDERIVCLHDFTPTYQRIKALDDAEKMREAQAAYLKKMLARSERARLAGKQRWKNAGYYQDDSHDDATHEMQNEQNTMLNQRVSPAESLTTSLTTQQLYRESNKDYYQEDTDSSRISKALNEGFFGESSPDGYTNRQSCQQPYSDMNESSKNSHTPTTSNSDTTVGNNPVENREYRKPTLEVAGGGAAAAQASRQYTSYRTLINHYGKSGKQLPQVFHRQVSDFSAGFKDQAPKSSKTQVMNIYDPMTQYGITEFEFIEMMYSARTKTNKHSIDKETPDKSGMNRMPYFIETLADLAIDWLNEVYKERQGNPYEQ